MPIQDPRKIDKIFDTITYNKGASLIRMLHNFLGDEVIKIEKNCNLIN